MQGNAQLPQTAVRCSMLEQLECKHVMAIELCYCYRPNVPAVTQLSQSCHNCVDHDKQTWGASRVRHAQTQLGRCRARQGEVASHGP